MSWTQESDQSNWWVNHLVQFVAKPVSWKEKGQFVHGSMSSNQWLSFCWTHMLWKPSAACLVCHVNSVTMVWAHGLLAPPVWGFWFSIIDVVFSPFTQTIWDLWQELATPLCTYCLLSQTSQPVTCPFPVYFLRVTFVMAQQQSAEPGVCSRVYI